MNVLNTYGYGSSSVKIKTKTSDGQTNVVTIKDVSCLLGIESNLMSVRKETQNGSNLTFENESCKLTYNMKILLEGKTNNNLYEIILDNPKDVNNTQLAHHGNNKYCIELWHTILGHRYINISKEIG